MTTFMNLGVSINCDKCLNKFTFIILRFSSYLTVNPHLLGYGHQLMLYSEMIAVCSEIYTKRKNELYG